MRLPARSSSVRTGESFRTISTQRAGWSEPALGVLDVHWRFAAGTLRFVANFGTDEAALPSGGGIPLWTSEGVAIDERIMLRPWTGAMLTSAA